MFYINGAENKNASFELMSGPTLLWGFITLEVEPNSRLSDIFEKIAINFKNIQFLITI